MPLDGPSTPQPSPPGIAPEGCDAKLKPPALRIQEVCRENPALLQIDCPSEDILARQRCLKGLEPFVLNAENSLQHSLAQLEMLLRCLARERTASDSMVFWELWDRVFVLLVEAGLATVDKLTLLHRGRLFIPQGRAFSILNYGQPTTPLASQPPARQDVGTSSMRRLLREEEPVSNDRHGRGPRPSLW